VWDDGIRAQSVGEAKTNSHGAASSADGSRNFDDLEFSLPDHDRIPDALADQVDAERGTRGDDHDLLAVQLQLQSPLDRSDKNSFDFAVFCFQSYEGGEPNRAIVVKILQHQGLIGLDRPPQILRAVCLPLRDVRGLEAEGVVFVVRSIFFVDGGFMGRLCGG
jgi:hypothetical protein